MKKDKMRAPLYKELLFFQIFMIVWNSNENN